MRFEKIVIKLEEGDQVAIEGGGTLYIRRSEKYRKMFTISALNSLVYEARRLKVDLEGRFQGGDITKKIEVQEVGNIGIERDGKWVPYGEQPWLKWIDYSSESAHELGQILRNPKP